MSLERTEVRGGVGVPGVAFIECKLDFDCAAARGRGECHTCHRTIAPDCIILGNPSDGDHCFINRKVEEKVWFRPLRYHQKFLQYPDVSESQNYVITCVKVADEWKDGTGGTVELESGGVGQNHVRIKLMSERGRGYAFDVAVYGRKV